MNNKNNIFIPIIVIGVSIAFVIISLLVFFSNGKPSFIKRKLQIGALLLTLTVSISTFSAVACCYIPYVEDDFNINSEHLYYETITVNIDDSNTTTVDGTIANMTSGKYSYKITDFNDTSILFEENIYALDGAYDENIEEFAIDLSGVTEGTYYIYFYNYDLQEQTQYNEYKKRYQLVVVNGKDTFNINSEYLIDGEIVVNLSNTTTVGGTITNMTSGKYSYRITKYDNVTPILFGENIYALDGAYDENTEEFAIDLSGVTNGSYYIYFYNYDLQEQTQNDYDYKISYPLVIFSE